MHLWKLHAILLDVFGSLISEIAGNKLSDNDILVLPLDVCKFETHKEAMENVLVHFNQVQSCLVNTFSGGTLPLSKIWH